MSKIETVKEAHIAYRNYRGEQGLRRIQPLHIWFGTTDWHSEPQWLLHAVDLDKQAERDFALCDISEWARPEAV